MVITLYPPCEIGGKVVYEGTGAPAPGIRVFAQDVANRFNVMHAASGENGEYRIRAMEPGTYTIWSRDAGHAGDWACLPIEKAIADPGRALENQDVILTKGIAVSGVITAAESKQPLKDVYVRAHLANNLHPGFSAGVKTGDDGRYLLRLPIGGRYEISAQSVARFESRSVSIGADQPAGDMDFALKPRLIQ